MASRERRFQSLGQVRRERSRIVTVLQEKTSMRGENGREHALNIDEFSDLLVGDAGFGIHAGSRQV